MEFPVINSQMNNDSMFVLKLFTRQWYEHEYEDLLIVTPFRL